MSHKDKQYYEDFYNKYDAGVHDSPSRFMAVAALLRGRVLDIACGTGTLSDYYAGDYTGVDVSEVAVSKAKEIRRKTANFECWDFFSNPFFSPQKYDSVYIGEFLEHIPSDDTLFASLHTAINPGALVFVTVPNSDRVPDESHCREFTIPQIRRDYSKYGKVRFYSWIGEKERIFFSIEMGNFVDEEITLVMIAKDEAKGIERAILSALPLVDRVIVSVDSKTQDDTAKIAKLYADELKEHVWEDDFSKARNFAQENVTSKWILFLDGHEYIEETSHVRDFLPFDVDGIFVTVRMESGMTFLFPRIYRKEIQFKNAVHNLNECKTKRTVPDFVIVHDRENGQDEEAIKRRNAQREEMLPRIMEGHLKEDPKNTRALFHLGNYALMREDTRAALKYYKRYMKCYKSVEEAYMVEINIGLVHASMQHYVRALWAFDRADKLLPGRWETARVIGGLYLMQQNYLKAANWLVQALTPNARRYVYQPMKLNAMEVWDMLGTCFMQLDQPGKSSIAFKRAKDLASTPEQKAFFDKKIELVQTLLPTSVSE
jgi:SAM-dependent methyltransferase